MKTYAKLEAAALRIMGRVPNISNPTDEQVAAYAAAHGFKELVETPAPGRYYRKGYAEGNAAITETWEPWELGEAKDNALREVQGKRDAAMNGVVIPCAGLPNGILYNTEAVTNALGLTLLEAKGALPTGQTWTDAADETHELTSALLADISVAMVTHGNGVQERFRPARDAVRAADDVDAVEAALELAEQLAAN